MIRHVALEVRPEEVQRSIEFWELLGFERVEPPETLGEFTWLERGGTQIHLLPTDEPTIPRAGHVAVSDAGFEDACKRIAAAGFEIERRGEHWGSPRAKATAPGGHTVELMEFPPTSANR